MGRLAYKNKGKKIHTHKQTKKLNKKERRRSICYHCIQKSLKNPKEGKNKQNVTKFSLFLCDHINKNNVKNCLCKVLGEIFSKVSLQKGKNWTSVLTCYNWRHLRKREYPHKWSEYPLDRTLWIWVFLWAWGSNRTKSKCAEIEKKKKKKKVIPSSSCSGER